MVLLISYTYVVIADLIPNFPDGCALVISYIKLQYYAIATSGLSGCIYVSYTICTAEIFVSLLSILQLPVKSIAEGMKSYRRGMVKL